MYPRNNISVFKTVKVSYRKVVSTTEEFCFAIAIYFNQRDTIGVSVNVVLIFPLKGLSNVSPPLSARLKIPSNLAGLGQSFLIEVFT